jgi:hypothetical protein
VDPQPAPGQHSTSYGRHDCVGDFLGVAAAREQVDLGLEQQALRRTGGGVAVAVGERVDDLEHGRRER